MYQPHLSRKFKLRCFRMEIDCKNSAILMSMLPEQIEKFIISENNIIFSKSFFLKKVFLQMHLTYCSGRGSGRCCCHTKVKNKLNIQEKPELIMEMASGTLQTIAPENKTAQRFLPKTMSTKSGPGITRAPGASISRREACTDENIGHAQKGGRG